MKPAAATARDLDAVFQEAARRRLAALQKTNPLRYVALPGGRTGLFSWFPKQLEAIEARRTHKVTGFLAGNRCGKTEWAVRETIAHGLGLEVQTLHERQEPPLAWALGRKRRIWCVTTTFEKSRQTQQRIFAERMPPALLMPGMRFNERHGYYNNVVTLANGTQVIFKTAEQRLNTFEGDSVDLCWIDEAVPMPYFRACLVRTVDVAGQVIWTTWPSEPELHDLFIRRELSPDVEDALAAGQIATIQGGMADNPLIPPAEIEIAKAMLPAEEVQGRIFGQFATSEGLVYAHFRETLHVEEDLPFPVSGEWTIDEIIDPGWDNRCAVAFCAVDRAGIRRVFDEIYERHMTVGEIATLIYARRWLHRGLITPADAATLVERCIVPTTVEDAMEQADRDQRILRTLDTYRRRYGDCRPRRLLIDEASKQTDQAKPLSMLKQLRQFGLIAQTVSNADKFDQRMKLREWLKPIAGNVMFRVAFRCEWTRWEFAHFRQKKRDKETGEHLDDRENVIAARNHLMSCLEYWASTDPKWVPPEQRPAEAGTVMARHAELQAAKQQNRNSWRKRG